MDLPSKYCSLISVPKRLMATFWYIYIHSPLSAFACLSDKVLRVLDCYCPQMTSKANTNVYFFSWYYLEKKSESNQKLWICREISDSCYCPLSNLFCSWCRAARSKYIILIHKSWFRLEQHMFVELLCSYFLLHKMRRLSSLNEVIFLCLKIVSVASFSTFAIENFGCSLIP